MLNVQISRNKKKINLNKDLASRNENIDREVFKAQNKELL